MPYYPPPATSTTGAPLQNFQAVNNNSTVQYWLIATLPISASSTYDSLLIQALTQDTFSAADVNYLQLTLGKKTTFTYKSQVEGYVSQNAGIRCYLESGGTVSVYAYLKASTFSAISVTIPNAETTNSVGGTAVTVYSTPTLTASPTGTLNYDSTDATTYPPFIAAGTNSASQTSAGKTVSVSGGLASYAVFDTTSSGKPDFLSRRSGSETSALLQGANLYLSNVTSGSSAGIQNYAGNMQFFNSASGSNTEKMRLDVNGNLGLDCTPSSWDAQFAVIEIGKNPLFAFNGTSSSVGNSAWYINTYNPGSGNKYYANGYANVFGTSSGSFVWYNAPSGTANSAITFKLAATLFNNGNFAVGYTTDQGTKLQVNGTGLFSNSGSADTVTVTGATTSSALADITITRSGASESATAGNGECIQLKNTTNATAALIQQYSSNLQFFTYVAGYQERGRFFANGNFAVGYTTDQGYKLQVNGTSLLNGNVGIGATLDSWSSSTVVQLPGHSALWQTGTQASLSNNIYNNGTNYIYATSAAACTLDVGRNFLQFAASASGTAGSVASLSVAFLAGPGTMYFGNGAINTNYNFGVYSNSGAFKTNGLGAGMRTITGTSDSPTFADYTLIHNAGTTLTLTLPSAATYPGLIFRVMNQQAGAVNSASSNVIPAGSSSAGTAILAATAGKWAEIQSDGSSWYIIMNN